MFPGAEPTQADKNLTSVGTRFARDECSEEEGHRVAVVFCGKFNGIQVEILAVRSKWRAWINNKLQV